MLLVLKAHKYIKRWRGSSGKYHYLYPGQSDPRSSGEKQRHPSIPSAPVPEPVKAPSGPPAWTPAAIEDLAARVEEIYKGDYEGAVENWLSSLSDDSYRDEVLSRVEKGSGIDGDTMATAIRFQKDMQGAEVFNLNVTELKDIVRRYFNEYGGYESKFTRDGILDWAEEHDVDMEFFDPGEYATTYREPWEILGDAIHGNKDPDERLEGYRREADARHEYSAEEAGLSGDDEDFQPSPLYTSGISPDIAEFYDLPQEAAEKTLVTGRVVGGERLGGGVNATFRVAVANGGEATAVFKPSEGEHLIHNGEPMRESVADNLAEREVATYEMDKLLGLGLVPPTVMKEVGGQSGSLQFWVEGKSGHSPGISGSMFKEDEVVKAALLDYLIRNTDRHDGNYLLDANRHLVLIDNGFTFPSPSSGSDTDEYLCTGDPWSRKLRSFNVPPEIMTRMQDVDSDTLIDKLTGLGIDYDSADAVALRWRKVVEFGNIQGVDWSAMKGKA